MKNHGAVMHMGTILSGGHRCYVWAW